jgi:hypothetical protein
MAKRALNVHGRPDSVPGQKKAICLGIMRDLTSATESRQSISLRFTILGLADGGKQTYECEQENLVTLLASFNYWNHIYFHPCQSFIFS